MKENKFERLFSLNVNEKVEKKTIYRTSLGLGLGLNSKRYIPKPHLK